MFENQISNLGSFQGVQLESDISVITLDDNINHTYCSKIKWEKDNRLPIGNAQLTMPYSDDIAMYWIKYSGPVVIHANLNSNPRTLTQSMMSNFPLTTSLNLKNSLKEDVETEKDEKTNQIYFKNDEYNYSFIGKVNRFKQVGKTFVVYLEDLGWKFLQKVPKEFRSAYISGQSLDDAFQAICEFIGVEFAYSIEDLHEYNFSADGYSIEKDGIVIENTPSLLKEWSSQDEEENTDEKNEDEKMADRLNDNFPFEASGLIEYKNKQKNIKKITNESNEALNSAITNTENNTEYNTTENQDENKQDITSKIEEYQEEFDEKIKNLFIGNTFYDSNTSDPILNYDWITIKPKVSSTSEMSTTGGTGGNSNTSSSVSDVLSSASDIQNSMMKGAMSRTASTMGLSVNMISGLRGGGVHLSISQIANLSPAMAATMSKNPKYDSQTIALLKRRGKGLSLFYFR